MATIRRFAALSDFDSAPDIYQTPELSDDVSTLPTVADSSPSDASADSDEDPDRISIISRRHVRATDARSHFETSNLRTGADTDFSDRIGHRQRRHHGYQTIEQQHDQGKGSTGEESVQGRIARLGRELHELKADIDSEAADEIAEGEVSGQGVKQLSVSAAKLGSLLDEIQRRQQSKVSTMASSKGQSFEHQNLRQLDAIGKEDLPHRQDASSLQSYHSTHTDNSALRQVAIFDARLAHLESSLGTSSLSASRDQLPVPVQPALDRLTAQVQLLSETTPNNIDHLGKQIQSLIQASEKLTRLRTAARNAADDLQGARERELRLASMARSSSPVKRSVRPAESASIRSSASLAHAEAEVVPEPSILSDPEALGAVQTLHDLLPTITDVSPILPDLVRRLQSLQLIHSGAGSAKDDLDGLEKKQASLRIEVLDWSATLTRLESLLKETATASAANGVQIEKSIVQMENRINTL